MKIKHNYCPPGLPIGQFTISQGQPPPGPLPPSKTTYRDQYVYGGELSWWGVVRIRLYRHDRENKIVRDINGYVKCIKMDFNIVWYYCSKEVQQLLDCKIVLSSPCFTVSTTTSADLVTTDARTTIVTTPDAVTTDTHKTTFTTLGM